MSVFTAAMKQSRSADLLVAGLGPAGLACAVAAARRGLNVLAVEKCGYAGGNITNANVIGVCGAVDMTTGDLINGGITLEMLRAAAFLRDNYDYDKLTPLSELDLSGARLFTPYDPTQGLIGANTVSMIYDAERYKLAADRLLAAAGVHILYHTVVCDIETVGGHIERVIIANKDGLSEICPKAVADCTGDGDIAAWSGAPFEIKPDTMQIGTMMFVAGGVEYDDYALLKRRTVDALIAAGGRGEIPPYTGPGIGRLRRGVVNFNMTRVKYDQTDPAQWTAGEMSARADARAFLDVLVRDLPEYKNAYMLYSGPNLGCRESRRIIGQYVLTADDILERKSFPDCVALGGNPLSDYHDPKKHSISSAVMAGSPAHNRCYGIPYRTIVPQKIDNLLVAGRCHSVDQRAAASTRVAQTASLLGEAAGQAAFLSLSGHCAPAEVDTERLRALLLDGGALLEY